MGTQKIYNYISFIFSLKYFEENHLSKVFIDVRVTHTCTRHLAITKYITVIVLREVTATVVKIKEAWETEVKLKIKMNRMANRTGKNEKG